MSWQVELTPTAEDDLRRLDTAIVHRIIDKVQWMANNIETIRHELLTGQWQGVFKLRVGAYRVLYTLESQGQRIVVHFVRHRREVYRRPQI